MSFGAGLRQKGKYFKQIGRILTVGATRITVHRVVLGGWEAEHWAVNDQVVRNDSLVISEGTTNAEHSDDAGKREDAEVVCFHGWFATQPSANHTSW